MDYADALDFVIFGYWGVLIACLTGAIIDLGKAYKARLEQ
jgi:hypothetical protein